MLDYLSIFKELNRQKIAYLVVGGLAVNFHGIPRMTYDIDVILDLEDTNLEKFLALLQQWGFQPRVPVLIMDFAKKDKREDWIKNKNMKAFNLVNPDWAIKEIDIVIDLPFSYREAAQRAEAKQLKGVSVPTISIADLISMKSSSAREQDKDDISNLRKVLNEK